MRYLDGSLNPESKTILDELLSQITKNVLRKISSALNIEKVGFMNSEELETRIQLLKKIIIGLKFETWISESNLIEKKLNELELDVLFDSIFREGVVLTQKEKKDISISISKLYNGS